MIYAHFEKRKQAKKIPYNSYDFYEIFSQSHVTCVPLINFTESATNSSRVSRLTYVGKR